jgi:tryptophanyl-tRNA synthetase
LAQAYADGIAWGDAKQMLFERIDREIAPMRTTYDELMAHPEQVETLLQQGGLKARAIATPFTAKLKHAVGLRPLQATAQNTTGKAEKTALPSFKQYREKDGQFYFKLADAKGRVLLQSQGFDSPKAAGQTIAKLKECGYQTCPELHAQVAVAAEATGVEADAALQTLRNAD